MNLGVEEQAQRRKKDRKRSRKKKRDDGSQNQHKAINTNRNKIFGTKVIQVEQRKIGLIIGQNGKHIKELYRLTHCDIILPKHKKKQDDDWDDINNEDYYYVYDSFNDTVDTNFDLTDEGIKDKENDKKDKDNDDELDEDDPKRLVEVKLRGTPEEIRDAEVEINFMIKKGRLMLDHERMGGKKK